MKKNLTEMVFILDKSGSMHGLEKDTIGGFNSMLDKQRKVEGEALISTVLFSDRSTVVHDRVSLDKVENMTDDDCCTGGCTALLDAVGDAVKHISNIHKYAREEDRPEHTIFVIITDGYENASKRYNYPMIRKLIEQQKEKLSWEFVFLGANIDAAEEADRLGIHREMSMSYACNGKGIASNFAAVSDCCKFVRRTKKPLKFIVSEVREKYDK